MNNNDKNKPTIDFSNMSEDQKVKILKIYDNFLEALYLSPKLFPREVIKFMKMREEKLRKWRRISSAIGGISFFSLYATFRLKSWKGFYFKNVCIGLFGAGLSGFILGRLTEYIGNRIYFKNKLIEISMNFNISDEEITDLQLRASERILERNKVQENKSSLDKIKFRL